MKFIHKKKNFSSFQIISLGFLIVILTGGFLLMLHFHQRTGRRTFFRCNVYLYISSLCDRSGAA